jgi:hypothetical protein
LKPIVLGATAAKAATFGEIIRRFRDLPMTFLSGDGYRRICTGRLLAGSWFGRSHGGCLLIKSAWLSVEAIGISVRNQNSPPNLPEQRYKRLTEFYASRLSESLDALSGTKSMDIKIQVGGCSNRHPGGFSEPYNNRGLMQ